MAAVERYEEPRMRYEDLPDPLRQKYPPSKAKYAGDAIAEREGILVPSKGRLNGYRCAGTSKASGARCGLTANSGSLLCRSHGGNHPKGLASPQYRHGARSQALPLRLQAQYQAAVADPELLSLRQDLGVLELRVTELLGQLDTGSSGEAWGQLQDLGAKLAQALGDKNLVALGQYLAQQQALLEVQAAGLSSWTELRAVLRDRAQLAVLEQKRVTEVQGAVPVEAVLALVGHLMQRLHLLLLQHLDPHLARGISGQFQQEVLALQQGGLSAPVPKHGALREARQLEPGTRRTVGYVPKAPRE